MASSSFPLEAQRVRPWPLADRIPAAAPVLCLALLLTWLRPIGYVGGDADDWHYLQAIRCAAEHGYCLPSNHWWQRFPIVAPSALASALLGESARTLWVVPAFYAAAAILLFVALVERQFGRAAALIGGFALVLTPVFTDRLLQIGINIAELAFMLAAAFCLQSAARTRSIGWTIASGAMLALAVQSRATALAALPLFGAALFLSPLGRKHAAIFGLGFLAPLAAETAAYAAAGADPLLPWKLSLAHTSIASTALEQEVSRGLPLFNLAVIDGWRPRPADRLEGAFDRAPQAARPASGGACGASRRPAAAAGPRRLLRPV